MGYIKINRELEISIIKKDKCIEVGFHLLKSIDGIGGYIGKVKLIK